VAHAAGMEVLCVKHQAELDALKKEHKTELLEFEVRHLQEQNQTLEEARQRRARFAQESANKRYGLPPLERAPPCRSPRTWTWTPGPIKSAQDGF